MDPTRVIGRHALYAPLGAGATASVHLGLERGKTMPVAIKVLHEERAKDANAVNRLLDEVRLAKRIQHPNVVRTIELVEEGTERLVVMEYVHGFALSRLIADVIAAKTRIPTPIAVALACDVLLGLQAAHQARDEDGTPLKIVHRDVSPENVLVGADGRAKLGDFGVAKAERRLAATRDGGIKGKLTYLAPEQIGGDVTERTDVYAVGLVLWEMLVLERPLEAETEAQIVARALDPKFDPPSARVPGLPPALDAVVLRALAKEEKDRWPSALAFSEALATAVPPATPPAVAEWMRARFGAELAERDRVLAAMLDGRPAAAAAPARPDKESGKSFVAPIAMLLGALGAIAVVLALRGKNEPEPAAFPDPPPLPVFDADPPAKTVADPVPPPPPPPSSAPTVAPTKRIVRPIGTTRPTGASCEPWIDDKGIKRYDPSCTR